MNSKERKKEYDRRYKREHKEEVNAYQRKYRQEHKEQRNEYMRKWRKANKDKANESLRRYREKNKEKIKERRKQYYAKNKERFKGYIIKRCERDGIKVTSLALKSKWKRVERLRAEGVTNAWCVVNKKAAPKYKVN